MLYPAQLCFDALCVLMHLMSIWCSRKCWGTLCWSNPSLMNLLCSPTRLHKVRMVRPTYSLYPISLPLLEILATLQHYNWEKGYLWASLDVCALYTSIPHSEGLRALQYVLYKDLTVNLWQAQFVIEGSEFCLQHNYFTFLDQFYLQLKGTAMGLNFAPCYTNIAVGYWEDFSIWNNNPFARKIVCYGRYIDDVLIIWNGTIEQFSLFCVAL